MPNGWVSYRRGRHIVVPTAGDGREGYFGGALELFCSGEHPLSPDWIPPYRLGAALGAETVRSHLGPVCGFQCGQVPVVAWPVRSSLSCCLAPVRSGPAAAWSQRNQAPVGCLAPTKLRAVRPTGLHGDCRHDQPCLHTHAPADSPVWNCPPEKLCGETGPSHNHPRLRARDLAVVPEIQA